MKEEEEVTYLEETKLKMVNWFSRNRSLKNHSNGTILHTQNVEMTNGKYE
jgi:hypothetical protein